MHKVFYYTSNELSRTIGETLGVLMKPISEFNHQFGAESIFYGILRGAGTAMRICQYMKRDFYYIDNGYFDAQYVDKNYQNQKRMDGTYRLCKNDMTRTYSGRGMMRDELPRGIGLMIPPTMQTANFYDTTPQDWMQKHHANRRWIVRDKDCARPLEEDIRNCDFVFAFNSMAVMKAMEMGKPATDTHGIMRGMYADYDDVKDYFVDKQYTLNQFKAGEFKWY